MDVFGLALTDFLKNGKAATLWLHNSYAEREKMPVDIFFRNEDEMPFMELKAIELCRGDILDVGAGAGSHALLLQEIGKDVTAMDLSDVAVDIMRQRGVKNIVCGDVFELKNRRFDTLLFLMNGIGLTGTLVGFKQFLDFAKSLVNPGGQLIFDSSDISYLYENDERPTARYFGEVSYCYEYKKVKGDWFNWLYLDQQTLKDISAAAGWDCTIVYDDGEDQYLAQLMLPSTK